MTPGQESKYWRTWGSAIHRNKWKMREGRLHPDGEQAGASQWHGQIWAFAIVLARQEGREVSVNDLRHGAHWLALGRDKSHAKFDNRDLDRVLTVFGLLINPDDLSAVGNHLAYQRGEDPGGRKRLLVGIESKAPAAYIEAIALDKFGTKNWKDLNSQQLFRLNMTLSNRRATWNKPVKEAVHAGDSENYPF